MAARQQAVDAAQSQIEARQAVDYQAYDAAVAEINPLLLRFGSAISRKLSAYEREYGPRQSRAFRRAKQFSDRFSVKRTAFSTSYPIAPGISVSIVGVDRYEVSVTLVQAIGSRANKLTVCPKRDFWMFETVDDSASAREGYYLYRKTLANGPEELCNFQGHARFGGCLKREYASNWRHETSRGFDFRAAIEELIVIFLDHCGIPYSSVTAPVTFAPTVGMTVARASVPAPLASATPPQPITQEQVYGTIIAINAAAFVIGGILACSGSALTGPWLGATVLGTLAFWGARGLVRAYFDK